MLSQTKVIFFDITVIFIPFYKLWFEGYDSNRMRKAYNFDASQ